MPYLVAGPFPVAGVSPGGEVTDALLGDADVAHLVSVGHLVAVAPPTPTKAEQAIPKEK